MSIGVRLKADRLTLNDFPKPLPTLKAHLHDSFQKDTGPLQRRRIAQPGCDMTETHTRTHKDKHTLSELIVK